MRNGKLNKESRIKMQISLRWNTKLKSANTRICRLLHAELNRNFQTFDGVIITNDCRLQSEVISDVQKEDMNMQWLIFWMELMVDASEKNGRRQKAKAPLKGRQNKASNESKIHCECERRIISVLTIKSFVYGSWNDISKWGAISERLIHKLEIVNPAEK